VEVAIIAMDAAEEAAKIATSKDLVPVAGNIREVPEEPEESHGNMPDLARMDVDEASVDTVMSNPANQSMATTLQIPPSSTELVISQHELGAPSSSGATGPNFDEEIARILLPLTHRSTEAEDAIDSAEDFSFLEAMAIGFKDVQERYSRKWSKA
jgi:hypothetical protein